MIVSILGRLSKSCEEVGQSLPPVWRTSRQLYCACQAKYSFDAKCWFNSVDPNSRNATKCAAVCSMVVLAFSLPRAFPGKIRHMCTVCILQGVTGNAPRQPIIIGELVNRVLSGRRHLEKVHHTGPTWHIKKYGDFFSHLIGLVKHATNTGKRPTDHFVKALHVSIMECHD